MLKRVLIVACAVFAVLTLVAPPVQAQDDPLRGSTVTIRNTFERDGDGEEPFGEPATATVSALIEFFPYGPYNVDVSGTELTFAWDSDPRWDEFERILEPGFFDRYYIDFEGVVVTSAVADGDANLVPKVSMIDDNTLLVEFSEGMDVSDGQIARISLKVAASDGSEPEDEAPEDDAADDDASAEDAADDADDTPKEEPKDEPKEEEVPKEEPAEESASSSGSLPRTGLDAEAFSAGALALLSTGGALVVARRRAARQALSR